MDAGRAGASTARPFAGSGSAFVSGTGSGESSEAELLGSNLLRLLFRVISTVAGTQGAFAAAGTPACPLSESCLKHIIAPATSTCPNRHLKPQPDSNGEAPDTEQTDRYEDPSFR